ncbi:Protein OS-9 [Orobanche minor]
MNNTWLCVVIFLFAFLLGDVVLSDQIVPAHTGGTFGRSSREPKFQIEFHSEDSPFHPVNAGRIISLSTQSSTRRSSTMPRRQKAS